MEKCRHTKDGSSLDMTMANPDTSRHSTAFVTSLKTSARRIALGLSPAKQTQPSYSFDTEYSPTLSTHRASISSISPPPTLKGFITASSSTTSLPHIPDKATDSSTHDAGRKHRYPSTSLPAQKKPWAVLTSNAALPTVSPSRTLSSSFYSPLVNPPAMIAAPFVNTTRPESSKSPGTTQLNSGLGQGASLVQLPSSGHSASYTSAPPGSLQSPNIVFQHVQETSSKRISTLDYLRKAHQSQVYWFNTLLFSKSDLAKMPYFDTRKLARRAANYLLLGLSLPNILDMNALNALDYLRALNALLVEFESYQQSHPPDGSSSSSLSRAKIPQMFKRAAYGTGSKGRRTSSATDIGFPMSLSDPADLKTMVSSATTASASAASSFPANDQELLPGEEYTHLLTPSLPFDPDFFETFTTLCDVLIDCYLRITSLVSSPTMCSPTLGDIFAKADGRIRKIIVNGIIKDFEEASRNGAKSEMAGISKVVLGGLM